MDRERQTSLLSKPGSFQNSRLEFNTFRLRAQDEPSMLHEGRKWNPEHHRRLVTCVVYQINGSWLGHEVDSGSEDDEKRRAKDLDKIKMKRVPKVENLVWTQTENFNENTNHDRYEQ